MPKSPPWVPSSPWPSVTCWHGSRHGGIIAAAISALFAIKLEAIGYAEASRMVPLTFMVIIGTVLLQSATAGPIARWLGVAEPEPKGFLIIGANAVSRAIGGGLVANGFQGAVGRPGLE